MLVIKEQQEGRDESVDIRARRTAAGATGQDPIASLHDTTEEAGDEAGVTDTYRIDLREAEELGVALDPSDAQRPNLR